MAIWLYIRMLLTHKGFPYDFINWIICCITSVSYSILILSYLLFVDDVLIFLNGNINDSTMFNSIIKLLCKATEMETN